MNLSKTERRHIESILRYVKATRDINLSELDRLVIGHLLLDRRPIHLMSLSELTGYSRRSVRSCVIDLKTQGLVEQVPEGWSLTGIGFTILLRLYREVRMIEVGAAEWFSEETLSILEDLPNEGVKRRFKMVG